MLATTISENIYAISVNDRTTDLFEGLWPISNEGVTYNSYIIDDEKKVLIDLTKEFKTDTLVDQIATVFNPEDLDYFILNHMEPDHTGAIKTLMRVAPNATILCTPKAVPFLKEYYGITTRIQEVADGETISIGKRTLQFFHTPFVHWPETMMTYDLQDKVLFSCDAFGGYGALRGYNFDDECTDLDYYKRESLRYYSNIVAKFSKPVLNAIAKLGGIEVKVICPSHGLLWRDHPEDIINLYSKWANYADGDTEVGVTLLYGSMYGNTEEVMNSVAKGISNAGVPVDIFDVARTHTSYILPSLWSKKGVIVGAPTYEGSLFPAMQSALEEAGLKRVIKKQAAIFGSYGWSGGAEKKIRSIVEPLKWEVTDTLIFRGGPTDDDLKNALKFGKEFAESLK
jgi:anaerobic nitric oxide reductase flavorubredoxin